MKQFAELITIGALAGLFMAVMEIAGVIFHAQIHHG